jgi:uncharacterized NAD(P)/FAD-binding protein YdhS
MSGETLRVDMQVSCVGWKAEWPHLQRESRSLLRRAWAWKDLHRHPSAGEVALAVPKFSVPRCAQAHQCVVLS